MNASNDYFSFLYKILKKQLLNRFLQYPLVEIMRLVREISSFPEVLYKTDVLKNLSEFKD